MEEYRRNLYTLRRLVLCGGDMQRAQIVYVLIQVGVLGVVGAEVWLWVRLRLNGCGLTCCTCHATVHGRVSGAIPEPLTSLPTQPIHPC